MIKKQIFLIANLMFLTFYANASSGNYLVRCNKKLIEVVMEDLFSPPVASRVHVYPNIAAYEVLAIGNDNLQSLSGQIKHLPKLTLQKEDKINYSIAAEFAFSTVAKKLVFSEYMIGDFEKSEKTIWQKEGLDTAIINQSANYGIKAGKEIIQWMIKDNYIQIKTMERYVLSDSLGAWRPTAPDYANGLEPNWPLMRSIAADSSGQIKPKKNITYNEDKNSTYYQNALAVYQQSQALDSEKIRIAWFWDCNPNISFPKGHITYYVHKISPGGHWLNITSQACTNLHFDELKTAEVYVLVTIGLYESFISCWNAKYKNNSLRPETYINRLIDPKWLPLIQTPPFPEYSSGHSTLSASSATILTHFVPQPYPFIDSSEMYINIAPRKFNSFNVAAQEASISRFYGGIHFMPALNNGAEHGKNIANFILNKLQTRKQ